MGKDVILWPTVCSSAPHSQAAVGAIPHLCPVERNKPTPVRRQLSLTQNINSLGRYIPSALELTSGIKVRTREVLPCHFVFHLVSAQHAALVSNLKNSFKSSSAAGTNTVGVSI